MHCSAFNHQLADQVPNITDDPSTVPPSDGNPGGDAQERTAQATHRAIARHGRETVHEGSRSEDPNQETEEAELGEPEVRARATE